MSVQQCPSIPLPSGSGPLRSGLATTLGVDPTPPLRELHQRILNEDPDLGAPQVNVPGANAITLFYMALGNSLSPGDISERVYVCRN